MSKTVKITQVKSPIGYPVRQRRTVEALGLKRMNHTVNKILTPAIAGMVEKVKHLVRVEEA